MQQPAVRGVDRNAAVPPGVPGQRDQGDLGVEAGDHADALEAEPGVAARLVLDPVRVVAPLLAQVALAPAQPDGALAATSSLANR